MKLNRSGDTLVEVLLSTVILSLIMASAFTLSNRATQVGQNSLERSQVSNNLQEQIEIIRAMRDGDHDSWQAIVDRAISGDPDYTACEPTGSSAHSFFISFDEGNFPVPDDGEERFNLAHEDAIQDFQLTGNEFPSGNVLDSKDDFFAIWVEPYRESGSNLIELHARACWEQLGGSFDGQANTIYSLQDF